MQNTLITWTISVHVFNEQGFRSNVTEKGLTCFIWHDYSWVSKCERLDKM